MALIEVVKRRFGTAEYMIDALHTANYTVDDVAEVVYEYLKLTDKDMDAETFDSKYVNEPMYLYLQLFKEACEYISRLPKKNNKYLTNN